MGQKVNPISLRLGINKTWDSRWVGSRDYAKNLIMDLKLRAFLEKKLKSAGLSKVIIERPANKPKITLYSAKPGIIIGKKGIDIEKLREEINKFTKLEVAINIVEIRKPELDAKLLAESIALQLEKRIGFRRVMKRAVQTAIRMEAVGIRINCAGRLGGAEIARTEWYREGRVPLHTFRSDIDYGSAEAHTTYGICGIKVWICRGEIMEHNPIASEKKMLVDLVGKRQAEGKV